MDVTLEVEPIDAEEGKNPTVFLQQKDFIEKKKKKNKR